MLQLSVTVYLMIIKPIQLDAKASSLGLIRQPDPETRPKRNLPASGRKNAVLSKIKSDRLETQLSTRS